MFEGIRKAMFMGMGAAALSWEKINSGIEELVSRGDITADEGKKLFEELSSRAEQEGRAFNDRIRKEIREGLREVGAGEHSRIADLERRVEALERRVNGTEVPAEEPDRID